MTRIELGDCREVMAAMDAESVDAIVTDPPYGLEFMGKDWDTLGTGRKGNPFDPRGPSFKPGGTIPLPSTPTFGRKKIPKCRICGKWKYNHCKASQCHCVQPDFEVDTWTYPRKMQDWHLAWATAALRVAKPGAHLLAFGGTRTFHRLACAIEDAGWEIRDTVMWVYGSGFPKSLDVSKAIDKAAGAKREAVPATGGLHKNARLNDDGWCKVGMEMPTMDGPSPATDAARRWSGWGTALKPAWEPVIVARKPLVGTVAENVLKHGTGAINVDGCRVVVGKGREQQQGRDDALGPVPICGPRNAGKVYPITQGRWPANLIHDGSDEVLALMPSGAARFFYCAKASKADRDEGCEGLGERKRADTMSMNSHNHDGGIDGRGRPYTIAPITNNHPTVKPTALMRYLCRLVTPPGGVILDPFMGSGSTGKAAVIEGFDFIGIEQDEGYVEIARARIDAAGQQLGL